MDWHQAYDEPESFLHRRLVLVQQEIRDALDDRRGASTRAVSICAGQGRDLIEVLVGHPDGRRVEARLVELDAENAATAQAAAAAGGLSGVSVVITDAGVTDAYVGAVPAHLVLACGVFGNVSDADIATTIAALPQLCAAEARVIWTRHRRPPDLTPTIRRWFEEAGFREAAFHAPDTTFFTVGVHTLTAPPVPLRAGKRLFDFVGFDALAP